MTSTRTKHERTWDWLNQTARNGFRERQCERNRERRQKHYELLVRIKDVPCMDCGGRFHHCQMEFDHRPDETKLLAIARNRGAKLERLLAEIEKCDIVCANCHALRTWQRQQQKGALA